MSIIINCIHPAYMTINRASRLLYICMKLKILKVSKGRKQKTEIITTVGLGFVIILSMS